MHYTRIELNPNFANQQASPRSFTIS